MQTSLSRLSLAAALMMGVALPVLAQGTGASAPALAPIPGAAVPGPRVAVTTPQAGAPVVPLQAARPAATPAAPLQAARPTTPAGTFAGTPAVVPTPTQSTSAATAPGTVHAPRPAPHV